MRLSCISQLPWNCRSLSLYAWGELHLCIKGSLPSKERRKETGPNISFSEGDRVQQNKAKTEVPLPSHLVPGIPEANSSNNPALGLQPVWWALAHGQLLEGNITLGGNRGKGWGLGGPSCIPTKALCCLEGRRGDVPGHNLHLQCSGGLVVVVHPSDECSQGFRCPSRGSVLAQSQARCLSETEKLPDAPLSLTSCTLQAALKSAAAHNRVSFRFSSCFTPPVFCLGKLCKLQAALGQCKAMLKQFGLRAEQYNQGPRGFQFLSVFCKRQQ